MFNKLPYCLLLFAAITCRGQDVQFQTNYSESFAVFQFMNSLSGKSGNNVYKILFKNSSFNSDKYNYLVAQFDSLNISYNYDFTDYPAGQKVGIDVGNLLRRNLILCDNIQDFKIRSMGLLPNESLINLIRLIGDFTPLYKAVIYQPYKAKFEEQMTGITDLIRTSNINYYFTEVLAFFGSSWDVSIPFVFSFYPLPHSKGFTATAVSNVAISAIADSLDNYKSLLSVMLHEISHVLYDERTLQKWNQLENWFNSNPSKVSRYANSLFNEAMATSVANGYLAAQLNHKEDTSRRWYGVKYINMMAKVAYPSVKRYIESRKTIDKKFVDEYIKQFEDHFSNWLNDLKFLMRGRLIVSERSSDLDLFNRLYEPAPGNADYKEISAETLKKMTENLGTKVIIINSDNDKKILLIKNAYEELKDWQPDTGKDFSQSFFLRDKTWLIILNNVISSTEVKMKNLEIK